MIDNKFRLKIENIEIKTQKHGEHDQADHGNRYGVSVAPEAIRETIQRVKDQGGLTIDMKDGDMPKTGFTVAKGKKFAEIVKADDFFNETSGEEIITSYLKQHRAELNKDNNYLGLWHNTDDGNVYLDVSENIEDEGEAIARGRERDQISIWDVVNLKEIPTGGTGAKKTRSRETSRFVKDDRRGDRGLRQRDLGEVRKRQERFKVIYFDYGLKPVIKHGEHDQSSHGSWATGQAQSVEELEARGFSREDSERIFAMKDVGPSKQELLNTLKPDEVSDEEILLVVENDGNAYAIIQDRVEGTLVERENEFSNMSESEQNRVREQLTEMYTNDYILENRDEIADEIREGRDSKGLDPNTLGQKLDEVFSVSHTGTMTTGMGEREVTLSSSVGYFDKTADYGDADSFQVRGDILNQDGEPVGEFDRSFYVKGDALMVEHSLLRIYEDEYKGTGFGSAFIRQTEDWYTAQGVDMITVTSGLADGARHWARAGYDFRDDRSAQNALESIESSMRTINGFEVGTPARQEYDSIRARAFNTNEDGSVNYESPKSMKDDGFPLPAEFANIGYKKGDRDWAGKNLMYGLNIRYSKSLTAEGQKLLEGPIDHDGDGLIYDGTPREKPAPSGKKN